MLQQPNNVPFEALSGLCPSPFTGIHSKGIYKKIGVTAEGRAGCRPKEYRVLERFRLIHFVGIEGLATSMLILLLA